MINNIINYNNFVIDNIYFSAYEKSILKSFEEFYISNENQDKIILFFSIINSTSDISIRLIDYFITQYIKKYKICIQDNFNSDNVINIYVSYKSQLKLYQKKFFDPFSRGTRIPYFIKNKCIITTIGQLNFFKWFLSKNIYEFIFKNKENIENNICIKYNNIVKISKTSKKTQKANINTIPQNKIYIHTPPLQKSDIIVYF